MYATRKLIEPGKTLGLWQEWISPVFKDRPSVYDLS